MLSFLEVWERIQEQEADEDALKAMEVIRKGLAFAKPGCKDFWESFKELCNNRDNLSVLLGVDPTIVSQWAEKIEKYLIKVRTEDTSDKREIIPTANEPLTSAPNNVSGTTADLRPN